MGNPGQSNTTFEVQYQYDVFDRRVSRTLVTTNTYTTTADGGEGQTTTTTSFSATTSTEDYVYDGDGSSGTDNVVFDFLSTSGGAFRLEHRYLYGPAVDQVLAQENVADPSGTAIDPAAANRVLWMLTDNEGTVNDIVDNSGHEFFNGHYLYGAYGNLIYGDTSLTRYLYTGREFDATTGLQYNRENWYDSHTGRWLSEDKAKSTSNPNVYAGDNPTNVTDSQGLAAEWWNDSGWDWANTSSYSLLRWLPNLVSGYDASIVNGTGQELKSQASRQESAIGNLASNINAPVGDFRRAQRLGTNTTELLTTAAEGAIQLTAAAGMFISPSGPFRSFSSFDALKRGLGSAGEGRVWHHIVEQSQIDRFGAEAIHTSANVVSVSAEMNRMLNGLYSSIRQDITGSDTMTVRQWLSGQSYEAARDFGLKALENVNNGIW